MSEPAPRDGKCPLCQGLIWAGESIVTWLAAGRWAHQECVERLKAIEGDGG